MCLNLHCCSQRTTLPTKVTSHLNTIEEKYMYRIIANKRIVKLLASGPQAESWFSAFQRWFRIENRTSFGEVMANYIKSV